jgi:hypothetical protein
MLVGLAAPPVVLADLAAGAAVVDVTPNEMPVLINGGMLSRTADSVKTRVNARALVLSDGETRVGLVVVDSCMMPKILLDDAKHRAAARTGLAPDHIMISATHTHTAPSSFGALGTDADLSYVPSCGKRSSKRWSKRRPIYSPPESAGHPEMRPTLRRSADGCDARIASTPIRSETCRCELTCTPHRTMTTSPVPRGRRTPSFR